MTGNAFRSLAALSALGIGLAAGCSDKELQYNDKVEGTVKMGGVPVANALVQFIPDGDPKVQAPTSTGFTNDQGFFTLTCQNQRPGAVLGKHNVVVIPGRAGGGGPEEDREAGGKQASRANIPMAYTIAAKTPLKEVVTADRHTYNLEIMSEPGDK